MGSKSNLCVQYVNALPSKKVVRLDELYGYDFVNEDKIVCINIDMELAFDYIMMISLDKMLSKIPSIERAALIRSSHPKYPGFQIILYGNLISDKSLVPKFISWEKLENHQKSMNDLLTIYED